MIFKGIISNQSQNAPII